MVKNFFSKKLHLIKTTTIKCSFVSSHFLFKVIDFLFKVSDFLFKVFDFCAETTCDHLIKIGIHSTLITEMNLNIGKDASELFCFIL